MKDLKRKVQWLEDVQKMELGLEPTLSATKVFIQTVNIKTSRSQT